ncbi:DUF6221 family protein [Nocardia wallacei]|uniref:DUF6221 family protein n=1 Tax=Nocardia wallacei TaxID=480035 RepID=UPI0024538ABE|nr:DUF6221 family protein [Nocardia wallacei]
MTIVEFIEARIGEREAAARAAGQRSMEWVAFDCAVAGGPFAPADPETGMAAYGENTIVYDEGFPLRPEAEHIALNDPAQALQDCTAMRLLIDAEIDSMYGWWDELDGCGNVTKEGIRAGRHMDERFCNLDDSSTLRALASAWSMHPNYRPKWAPTQED